MLPNLNLRGDRDRKLPNRNMRPGRPAHEFPPHESISICLRSIVGECFSVGSIAPEFLAAERGHCTNMHITRHHDFASLASSLSIWNELAHGCRFGAGIGWRLGGETTAAMNREK